MSENLTIKEIVNNAVDEMQRAQDTIKALYESLGEPIGSNESITDDEMLIEDMSNSIERLATIENTILVALNAAVYAGNIESDGKGFVGDFGADNLDHRAEYLAFAEQYELPYQEDGKIATDVVYDEVSKYMQEHYTTSKLNPKEIAFKENLEDIYDASNVYGINVDALSDDEIIELYDDVQEILANDDMYSDIYNDAVNTALKNFKDK